MSPKPSLAIMVGHESPASDDDEHDDGEMSRDEHEKAMDDAFKSMHGAMRSGDMTKARSMFDAYLDLRDEMPEDDGSSHETDKDDDEEDEGAHDLRM